MRSLADLIPKLLAATNAKKLAWEKSVLGGQTFKTQLGEIEVGVWGWLDDSTDQIEGVTANLVGKSGQILDEVKRDEFAAGYNEVRELLLAARRSALNVEDVIADLDAKLDKLL